MFIILYDNRSGHFTCFQLNVLFVDDNNKKINVKFANPFGNFSLESILSTEPKIREYDDVLLRFSSSPDQSDQFTCLSRSILL